MKGEKLLRAIGRGEDDLILEADAPPVPKKKKTVPWRWLSLAACAVLACMATLLLRTGGYSSAAPEAGASVRAGSAAGRPSFWFSIMSAVFLMTRAIASGQEVHFIPAWRMVEGQRMPRSWCWLTRRAAALVNRCVIISQRWHRVLLSTPAVTPKPWRKISANCQVTASNGYSFLICSRTPRTMK